MKFDSDINNTREMPTIDVDSFKKVSESLPNLPNEPEIGSDFSKSIESEKKPEITDFYAKAPSTENVNAKAKISVLFDEEAPEPKKAGEFDDFIIGKGFKLGEQDDNIVLNSGKSHSNVQRNTKAAPSDGKRKRKKQNKGCLGAFVWIFVILVISVGLAVGAIFSVSDVMGIGKDGTSEVNIPQGSSTTQIAESLKDAGAIRFPILFRLYSKLKHTDSTYQYGLYTIKNEGGYDGIIDQLQDEGAKAETITLRISEMTTVKKIAALLEENGVCKASDFTAVMNNNDFDYDFITGIPAETVTIKYEGYLAPDTYEFYITDSSKTGAESAMRKMLEKTNSIWTAEYRAKAQEMGYSIHQIMTMASIIECEAGGASEADMRNVAAVFYNRLSWNDAKLLGSSPTAGYATLYGNPRYDTNKYEGLPPGPVCAPSANAIEAALNPTENFQYYYFVTDASAQFHYSKTLSEHNSTISSLKNSGNWLGDGDLTQMFN